jgi:hypothetical protein
MTGSDVLGEEVRADIRDIRPGEERQVGYFSRAARPDDRQYRLDVVPRVAGGRRDQAESRLRRAR